MSVAREHLATAIAEDLLNLVYKDSPTPIAVTQD
jgi:hypothetical protein